MPLFTLSGFPARRCRKRPPLVPSSIRESGFTVIEMMLTVATVGVLALIATSSYTKYRERIQIMEPVSDIGSLAPLIGQYALDNIGVQIALDDFGTGYSSLAYLKRSPVNVVKIDRSFVKDLPADEGSAAITAAIIAMAHALRKKVVAEGVATAEQAAFLRRLQCDHIQGYYLSVPLSPVDLAALIQRTEGEIERTAIHA